ncbi:MAG: response regulator [Kiritimatiellia bacterium]|jgi:two-component system response regulator AdeR|nr:response regulator [Kiritimatiellia bacterium]
MPIQVLVIDDEPLLCQLLKRGLEGLGHYQVNVALSGRSGLRMTRRHKPDIIILDVHLPKMDGLEVLRALKSTFPISKIPVIMLSGLGDDATRMKCNYEYSEEYIEKPVELAVLNERILAILQRYGRLPPPPVTPPPAAEPATTDRPPDPGAEAP